MEYKIKSISKDSLTLKDGREFYGVVISDNEFDDNCYKCDLMLSSGCALCKSNETYSSSSCYLINWKLKPTPMNNQERILEAEKKIVELQNLINDMKEPVFKRGDVIISKDSKQALIFYDLGYNNSVSSFIGIDDSKNILLPNNPKNNLYNGIKVSEFRFAEINEYHAFFEVLFRKGYKWDSENLQVIKSLDSGDLINGEYYRLKAFNDAYRSSIIKFDKRMYHETLYDDGTYFKSNGVMFDRYFISKATPEEIEELKSKSPKRWRAKKEGDYYTIVSYVEGKFIVKRMVEEYSNIDSSRFESGNYAQREEELQSLSDEFNAKLLKRRKL